MNSQHIVLLDDKAKSPKAKAGGVGGINQSMFSSVWVKLVGGMLLIGLSFMVVTQEQLKLLGNMLENSKVAVYQSMMPEESMSMSSGGVAGSVSAKEEDVRWRSCHPDDMDVCTHRNLTYNLRSFRDISMFLLEDFNNIRVFQPEKICNVKYPKLIEGLFHRFNPDYKPQVTPDTCAEDFLYYGYYQTSDMTQAQDRVRLSKYTEVEMAQMYAFMRTNVGKQCPGQKVGSRVLYITRNPDTAGMNLPPSAMVPKGEGNADPDAIDVDLTSFPLVAYLCKVQQYQVVVAPYSDELILPIVMGKPFVALKNDANDYYFHESIAQTQTPFIFLKMNSKPFDKKLDKPYFNNLQPTPDQIKQLETTIADTAFASFSVFPVKPNGMKISGSLIERAHQSRAAYLKPK